MIRVQYGIIFLMSNKKARQIPYLAFYIFLFAEIFIFGNIKFQVLSGIY